MLVNGEKLVRIILFFYLRYGARPRGLREEDICLIDSVCRENHIWDLH